MKTCADPECKEQNPQHELCFSVGRKVCRKCANRRAKSCPSKIQEKNESVAKHLRESTSTARWVFEGGE